MAQDGDASVSNTAVAMQAAALLQSTRRSRPPTPHDSSSSDDDFEVSDVEGDFNEVEKKERRKEKIKAKLKEKAEKKAQKLFKKKMKEEREKNPFHGSHSVSHSYEPPTQSSSNLNFTSVPMGKIPRFDGNDYSKWAADMKFHLYGLHPSLWTIVVVGVKVPEDGVITQELQHDIFRNAQAARVISSSLSAHEYNKIRGLECAKGIWDTIRISHEGDDQVKEGKIDLIHSELESFVMLKEETLQQMYDRLMLLVTDIRTLGSKDWDDSKVVKKMLRAYTPRNPTLATMIRRDSKFKKMTPIDLLNDLAHDQLVELNVAKQFGQSEIKPIALKAEQSSEVESSKRPPKPGKKDDSSEDESTDEELALMVRNFKKFLKRKGDKKGVSQRRCYECKEVGHYIADCPHRKDKANDKEEREERKQKDKYKDKERRYKEKSKEYKKKYGQAHVGQGWESSDDSDNENVATLAIMSSSSPRLFNNISDDEDDSPMCLMAKGTKVSLESTPSSTSSSPTSKIENTLYDEEVTHKENMIKEFGEKGYKLIKKLMEKLERKKESLDRQEDLLILEKERNLAHQEALVEEKVKVEKLTTELFLANDSCKRMSKDHTLANESLAKLKNTHSELQESFSCLRVKHQELEANYGALWESTKTGSNNILDPKVSTSEGCSKCYKIDINACLANLAKLEESMKAKNDQIHRLNLLVGKKGVDSNVAYKAGRLPGIVDGLGFTRGGKANGRKLVNGKQMVMFKKGTNLGDLMNMAHGFKSNTVQAKPLVESSSKVKVMSSTKGATSVKTHEPSPNYTVDYMVTMDHNGKMVVKYVGAHTRKMLRSVWVPKMSSTNLQGPKLIWVPKSRA